MAAMSSPAESVSIGEFALHGPTERDVAVFGQSPDKKQMTGMASSYRVQGPENILLRIHDTVWKDGTRSISTIETSGNRALGRLEHGLTLGIREHGDLHFCELRQARITDQGTGKPWSQLFKASRQQLNQGAGMDVFMELKNLGVVDVGTKESLLGESNRRRKFLCATFRKHLIFSQWEYICSHVLSRCARVFQLSMCMKSDISLRHIGTFS